MESMENDIAVRPELSELPTDLLDAVAAAAIECGHTDAPYLIATDEKVMAQFIAFHDELKANA